MAIFMAQTLTILQSFSREEGRGIAMATVFIIALAFTDWDDCWNWAHAHEIKRPQAEAICVELERPRSLAPLTSPRPKARGD